MIIRRSFARSFNHENRYGHAHSQRTEKRFAREGYEMREDQHMVFSSVVIFISPAIRRRKWRREE